MFGGFGLNRLGWNGVCMVVDQRSAIRVADDEEVDLGVER